MVDIILANSPSGAKPIRPSTLPGSSPQIIVIPQSLLNTKGGIVVNTNNVKKPILKVQPNQKAGLKRPVAMVSPDTGVHKIKLEEDATHEDPFEPPVRKRANLDHLTPEEKMMRRKLKNRVAAQNARDKKRARMEDMEDLIKKLQEDKEKLRLENEQLTEANQILALENKRLKSTEIPNYLMPPSPESLPPQSPVAPSAVIGDQAVVVPRLSEPAELMNGLLPKGQSLGTAMNPELNKQLTACLFWISMVSHLTANTKSQDSKKSPSRSMTSQLPLKKRANRTLAWSPT